MGVGKSRRTAEILMFLRTRAPQNNEPSTHQNNRPVLNSAEIRRCLGHSTKVYKPRLLSKRGYPHSGLESQLSRLGVTETLREKIQ
jgi:hypothetical protein